jgi:hypothetical protein
MPNYCYNSVTITIEDAAKADQFESFLTQLQSNKDESSVGLLGYFLPRPAEEDENWYGWNCENWGTKWDVHRCDWHRTNETFELTFDTAWSPPIGVFEQIHQLEGFDVFARYDEPGMCFVGEFSDGEDVSYTYDFDDENWRDYLPEHVIEDFNLEDMYQDCLEFAEDEDEDV